MNSRSIFLGAAIVLASPVFAWADSPVTPHGQVGSIVLGERLSMSQGSAIERAVDVQPRSAIPADEIHPSVQTTRKVRVVYPLPVNP